MWYGNWLPQAVDPVNDMWYGNWLPQAVDFTSDFDLLEWTIKLLDFALCSDGIWHIEKHEPTNDYKVVWPEVTTYRGATYTGTTD